MGWGVKDFDVREARENFLAPHPKLANRWGRHRFWWFSLLRQLKAFYEWCLTSEGGALTIFEVGRGGALEWGGTLSQSPTPVAAPGHKHHIRTVLTATNIYSNPYKIQTVGHEICMRHFQLCSIPVV